MDLRIITLALFYRLRQSVKDVTTTKRRVKEGLRFCSIGLIATSILLSGCRHYADGHQAKSTFEEANVLFGQGDYGASLNTYERIIEKYPATGDRALFEMGITYSYPKNEQKDYQKALECFQKLLNEYPVSEYRQNSASMIFYINNVAFKDQMLVMQQAHIATLRQEVTAKESTIVELNKKIVELEQKMIAQVLQKAVADTVLIEKKARKLTLFSKGEVLKTYKVALGGNPEGPKERHGDQKTPEGIYVIDSRNKNSRYHRSLHISYPNEKDKKRAKERGVSPGGDIMIHGIKNGFAWVGDAHAEVDWTKGCIAVTDEEIEEIDKLVPNGTVVEIRP